MLHLGDRPRVGRVLVVEDEPEVANEIRDRLSYLNVEVIGTESSGSGVVEAARRSRPDLVLIDLGPDATAGELDAANEIQRGLDIPVVLLTPRTDRASLERVKAFGPHSCLMRPFRDGDLALSIELALHRHGVERELRQSEIRYSTTLASIGDGVLAADGDGRVTFMNPVAEVLTGWRCEAAAGQPADVVLQLVDEESRRPLANRVRSTIWQGESPAQDAAVLLVARSGALTPVDYSISQLTDPHGRVSGVVVAFRDIRQRRLAEDAARRAEDQLRHGQRMEALGHLACGIAHDFNNLLTVINGYADALVEEGGWDPRVARMLAAIHKAGARSTMLTSQLLAFSRKQTPETQAIDLNCVVRGLRDMLGRLIGEDVTLLTRLDPAIGLVCTDGSKIEQVIMNLVLNARDALPRGGRVIVETSSVRFDEPTASPNPIPGGDYVLLSVADTGVGIKPGIREHIFEPFFTTKELGKGTGLGLATVYGIVRQAGGHILVFSAIDRGTVFKVYLPVIEGAACRGDACATAAPPLSGSETILLVEDDPDVCEFASLAISHFGFKVLTAQSGVEALALCESYPEGIDLLVSDVIMPLMNGPDLAERVRRARPGIRVLFLSGYTDDVLGKRGLEAHAFLQKPFSSEALARKIRDVIDSPRARQ